MYEQVFNFNARPFTSTPYVKHYFAGESINSALGQARVCIDRGSGPAIVVGGTGTGKSLLLAMLEEQYKSQFNVVNLACARLGDRQELLQNVLFELQLPFKDQSETELRFSLLEFLKPGEQCPNGILLLVDEAHTLSTCLLDEICLIMNFVRDGLPRVRLVMAGNQRLEENLGSPKLESLNQRIASRCYLRNMSREETGHYVCEHIDRVGGKGVDLFEPESLKAIHEVSEGCPRLINQVSDHALILAATRGHESLNADCIFEAWADVQSIPGTYQPAGKPESQSGNELASDENWTVIEFGQLEDDEPTSGDTTPGTVYDFENNEPTTTAFDTEHDVEEPDEYRLSPEEPTIQDDFSSIDSRMLQEPNEANSTHLEPSIEFTTEPIEATNSFPSESSTETEESFVGWGAQSQEDKPLSQTQTPVEITNQAHSLLQDSANESKPDTCFTSNEQGASNQEIHTEQENDCLAELTAPNHNDALDSLEDHASQSTGNSIEDLEAEQNQIFEQVDQEQPSPDDQEATQEFVVVENSSIELEATESDESKVSPAEELVSAIEEQGVEADQAFADAQPDLLNTWEGYTSQEAEPVENTELAPAAQAQDEQVHTEENAIQEPVAQTRQPVETVDPFAESFAEEEKLLDRYAPFVINQNQSSLSVTSQHLSMLVPIDQQTDPSPMSHEPIEAMNTGHSADLITKPERNQDSDADASVASEFVAQETISTAPETQDLAVTPAAGIVFGESTESHETTGTTSFVQRGLDARNDEPCTDQPSAREHEDATTATSHQVSENLASHADPVLSGVTENPTAPTWVETPPPASFSDPNDVEHRLPGPAEIDSQNDNLDVAVDHQEASETENNEADIQLVAAEKIHQHGDDDATSAEIQRQAEAILARLNNSRSQSNVSHETATGPSSKQPVDHYQTNEHTTTEIGEPNSGEPSDFEKQSAALDQSQQILNEILEQKNSLKQSHEIKMNREQDWEQVEEIGDLDFPAPVDATAPESVSSNDDKEMIIVNQMEETIEPQATTEPPIQFPPTPVSTGRAERMDYQKLFDQLRDISHNPE